MAPGHVVAHLGDKIVLRGGSVLTEGCAALLASGAVLDPEDDIEELNEGALGIAPAAVLAVRGVAVDVLIHDAPRQAGLGHVLTTGEEGSDSVVEDGGVAVLVDALEDVGQVREALGEGAEAESDGLGVTAPSGFDGSHHSGQDGSAAGLDGDGDEVEPRLVEGAGESV